MIYMDAAATTTKVFTVLGTTDDVTTCDCCGRANLKATVVLRNAEGDVAYYGRSCAAKATGWTVKDVDRGVRTYNEELRRLHLCADAVGQRAYMAVIDGWLAEQGYADQFAARRADAEGLKAMRPVAMDANLAAVAAWTAELAAL